MPAPHSLLAAVRLSPRLHVPEKTMLLADAMRVAKDPGTWGCKQHAADLLSRAFQDCLSKEAFALLD